MIGKDIAESNGQYQVANDLPAGYKQTEAGVIPEDWQYTSIGEHTSWMSGGTPSRGNEDFWMGDIPWISGSTLKTFEITKSDQHLTMEAVSAGSKMAPVGSVLVLVRGSALHNEIRAGLVVSPVAFNQDVKALIPDNTLDERYFTFFLLGMENKLLKLVSSAGNSAGVLDTQLIKNFPLLLPSIKEQTAIANALSGVDALINELEKLITKKQAIKTATMQQLLTGRTRLPQYALREDGTKKGYKSSELGEVPEDWGVKTIAEYAPLQRGFDLPNRERVDGKYPVVYSNGVMNYHESYQVKGPGVITGRSGTIGRVHYIEENYWPHNTALWVTEFKNAYPKYVYYLYVSIGFERFASGSGVPTLNRNDAHSFKIAVPSSLEEQTAIATILSNMDEEIQTLQHRLNKTRQIKQGMMQELLTGKTRLI